MLVLSRKLDEKIMIGDSISVMVVAIRGNTIRLGIDAPADVPVHREEIYQAIQAEQRMQAAADAEAPQEPTAP